MNIPQYKQLVGRFLSVLLVNRRGRKRHDGRQDVQHECADQTARL